LTFSADFGGLRARWVIIVAVASMFAAFTGAEKLFPRMWDADGNVLAESFATALWYSLISAFLLLYLAWRRLPLRMLFGGAPRMRCFIDALRIVLPVALLSIGLFYLLWYPVSLAWPGFVQSWALDSGPAVIRENGSPPVLANLAQLLLVAVFVPVVEETLFRGFLLPRWAVKWNLPTGVILSSGFFAVLHADTLGAFVFSLIVSVLYLRTGSLFTGVFLHGLNNALVWLIELAGGEFEPSTLADFQSEIWLGGLGLLVGLPWAWRFFHHAQDLSPAPDSGY